LTTEEIKALFEKYSDLPVTGVDKLPQAGSDRSYFRIYTPEQNFIATHGSNVKENESFIYFSRHFKEKQLATPEIFYVSEDTCCYIQEDFGNTCLLDKLEEQGFTAEVYELYRKSLAQLALLQVKGHEGMDYRKCLTNAVFGKQAIMADLLYFKYYFLDALGRPYDKQKAD
jgi:aminoglycoside/choline kinase family phosphotransferase